VMFKHNGGYQIWAQGWSSFTECISGVISEQIIWHLRLFIVHVYNYHSYNNVIEFLPMAFDIAYLALKEFSYTQNAKFQVLTIYLRNELFFQKMYVPKMGE
jgi:hypothetical protein